MSGQLLLWRQTLEDGSNHFNKLSVQELDQSLVKPKTICVHEFVAAHIKTLNEYQYYFSNCRPFTGTKRNIIVISIFQIFTGTKKGEIVRGPALESCAVRYWLPVRKEIQLGFQTKKIGYSKENCLAARLQFAW